MISKSTKDYHVSMPFYEIRLSVTGACNQNCIYCGPFVDGKHVRGYGLISLDQIRQLVDELKDIINKQNIHIQITGGEPTLRSDLVKIFALLNREIKDIGMTTNGSRINLKLAKELVKNGLSDIHIHLPSLNKEIYEKTTRTKFDENRLQNILDAVTFIKSVGRRVEFNTPVTNINVSSLPGLLDFCYKNKINLKLIEELRLDDFPHITIDSIKNILADWINENGIATKETKIKNKYGIIYNLGENFFFRIAPVYKEFKKNLAGESKKILLDGRYWVGGDRNSFLFTPSYSLHPIRGTIENLKKEIKAISQEYKKTSVKNLKEIAKNDAKPIVVMLSYARSGGTLLNRCIASLPGTFVLSEVNIEALCPSSCNTIKKQAKKWYGLELKSEGFIENINEIYEYCISKNLTLIIRDWTFGSFVPSRYNNFNPSKSLATLEAISKSLPVVSFAFIRDAVDIWLSFNASPRTFYDKNLEYLYNFISVLIDRKIKIFRYEDFCLDPEREMKAICHYVGLRYDDQFMNYSNCFNVTGDIDLPKHSRGIKQGKICLPLRRKVSVDILNKINFDTKAKEINKLLDYKH